MRIRSHLPLLLALVVPLVGCGSEEQKQFFLPKMLAGQVHFAIGYTEPEAGTDLASLRTSATRTGDKYVINGQKIWTSAASFADYCFLLALSLIHI